jgi:hypothetical protein
MDGCHPLQDEDVEARRYRDGAAVLAYNIKRVIEIIGVPERIKAILASLSWLRAQKFTLSLPNTRFCAI